VNAADVATAAQLACLLEVSAPKPGNVSPGRHFHDTRYEDFLASAAAIGPSIALAGERPLGATIHAALESTARWTGGRANTNLGIVLLFAPLARAAILQTDVTDVLAATTVDDARATYAAIRSAHPGGLGGADAQDVSAEPTVTLRDAMALAADRDAVAREYVTGYSTTYSVGVPALERARRDRLAWDDAVVETFLALLASGYDTHIARKLGWTAAEAVSARAAGAVAAGGVRTEAGRAALADLDRALRDDRNRANPGTTADLTAAALFVWLTSGANISR
jgi:triphosphoribosyl-dephospho-CoA synthase